MRVLVVDPGMATGMAAWRDGQFEAWQEDDPMAVAATVWHDSRLGLIDELVVEDFILSSVSRAKTTAGIRVTLELIGALRFIALYHEVSMHLQAPADAKTFSTNEKLKAVGFITPAKPDHMRSAARHLLLRLVRNGAIDPLSLLP